ncbi:MAG: PAS domain S-box protein, partial [Magnetococcales bacterium]|nr:PAS domain S-box protein [Magnetococcales bacterium]
MASVLFSLFHAFELKRINLDDKEHELNRAARYLEKFLVSMNDIIIVCSQRGEIEKINRPEILGYAKTALLGKPVRMLLKERDGLFGDENLLLLLKTGSFQSVETRLTTLQGEKIPVLITSSVLRDQNKEIMSIILAAREISDYKKAQAALREQEAQLLAAQMANQTKSDFLAAMSHEIRTPMNAVMGLTDLALRGDLPPKTRNHLVKISHASRSLLRIIDDILDYSKIEAGKLELESTDFVLRDVFDHLMELFRHHIAESNLDLVVFLSREAHFLLTGDPLRLEQILMNLISNAIKFTQSGSIEVAVKTMDEKDQQIQLEFSVRDTGIGLTREQTSRLFQPFQQADGSTTRKYGGTGLGLSICKRLVEMLQGRIWVESIPEQGSVFRFTAKFGHQAGGKQRLLIAPEVLQNLRVLGVDDNASARQGLKKTLQSFSLDTLTADSGEAAVAAAR